MMTNSRWGLHSKNQAIFLLLTPFVFSYPADDTTTQVIIYKVYFTVSVPSDLFGTVLPRI